MPALQPRVTSSKGLDDSSCCSAALGLLRIHEDMPVSIPRCSGSGVFSKLSSVFFWIWRSQRDEQDDGDVDRDDDDDDHGHDHDHDGAHDAVGDHD